MKNKNPHDRTILLLMLCCILYLVVFNVLFKPSLKPLSNANVSLADVLTYCGLDISAIRSVEDWDMASQLSIPELDELLTTPVIAQILSKDMNLGDYQRVQLLNIGLTEQHDWPQLMYFESKAPDWRVFIRVFRFQSEAGYCGTFELGRNG